jgi:hypothetical protein
MAVLPTIPTSFDPHSASTPPKKIRSDLGGAVAFFSYAILGVVFLLAISLFIYGRILSVNLARKDAALAEAEKNIDTTTVESFVQLRNRLDYSGTLLSKHVALSNFFKALENILPATVRFNSLHINVDQSGYVKLEGTGTAKTFNALAAVSTSFAQDGRIKDAIFSKITVNANNTVSFALTASLDPKLVAYTTGSSITPASVPSDEPVQTTEESVAPTESLTPPPPSGPAMPQP